MVPTIHINGTPKDRLVEALHSAYRTVRDAAAALSATAPNGRDYYLQGPEAIHQAVKEHAGRQQRLKEVEDDLLALFEAIEAQGP